MLRNPTSKEDTKKLTKADLICKANQVYIDLAQQCLNRVAISYKLLISEYKVPDLLLLDMQTFRDHGDRQIAPIRRRVIEGETIPHDEKVFSLFQPHTEWISKSKTEGALNWVYVSVLWVHVAS
ncbi:MAG: hypothetical protein HOE45_04630 [Gammaproteobacteria bacterium]|jgi:transposase, IS5 family|nr:hypothetical protein [Gammaproteobacteria bacterium]MBT5223696.1 hypothetical protein [Gammaproteobacteria bacterium]